MFAVLALALVLAGGASQSGPTPMPPPAPVATPPMRCTAATIATCAAGTWTGAFVGADWTIALTEADGTWRGRYRTSRGTDWHPLTDLSVADGVISFGIVSTPRLGFRLTLDPATDTLRGSAEINGHPAMPFTAARTV